MRIVGIEQTTDHLHPETRVRRFTTERAARKWLLGGGELAFPGAADASLPMTQQNFHRRYRRAYILEHGWRVTRREVAELRGRDYRARDVDLIAALYRRHGEEIRAEETQP